MSRHPNDDVLARWLESGKPARVARHIESCDPCLERLDALSVLADGVRSGLDDASAPPVDLHARTAGGVHGRLAAEEAAAAFVELFALPWRTAAAILDPGTFGPVVDSAAQASNDSDDDGEQTDG